MKTKTVTYSLYQYNELSDDAKEKALEWGYDLNIDYDWWEQDGLTGFTAQEIRKHRLTNPPDDLLTYKHLYFDIGRGDYIQFDNARFTDDETARKFLGVPKSLWEQVYWHINSFPGGRETNTRLEYEAQEWEKEFTKKQFVILDNAVERFADKMHDCLFSLRNDYKYRTSREVIEETIEINEYTFDIDGNGKD